MRFAIWTSTAALTVAVAAAQMSSADTRAREIFKQLIEINTTDSVGDVTKAATAMADRLKAGGFAPANVQVLGPDPRKHNLVARYHGTGDRKPLLLLAHLDVVEARREDWSFDPFVFLEKDGFYYGRGTSDDKSMAATLAANIIRLKQENFRHDRDLIDAELALNEGGSGQMKHGRYLINQIQAGEKVYQDFRLETRNAGGHS